MAFTIHKANQRGKAEHGWLHSRFSFSFAEYYDPARMGFGVLRTINDDIIEKGKGFSMHPHRDMEIVSIVTQGVLIHQDSEGNRGEIHVDEIQYMSAGSGVLHSEFASEKGKAALFQIWIQPDRKGAQPLYAQRDFRNDIRPDRWLTLVSPNGEDHSIAIRQDALIKTAHLNEGKILLLASSAPNHGRLLFIVEGSVEIEGVLLEARDEVQITEDKTYEIKATQSSRILLFDVAML